jgi:hypothetical protein
LNVKDKLLVSHLSALAELALSIPESTETRGEETVQFVLEKIIDAVSPSAGVCPNTWMGLMYRLKILV